MSDNSDNEIDNYLSSSEEDSELRDGEDILPDNIDVVVDDPNDYCFPGKIN